MPDADCNDCVELRSLTRDGQARTTGGWTIRELPADEQVTYGPEESEC